MVDASRAIMNLIFKLLLTINATSWMAIIYVIKKEWTLWSIPVWLFGLILILYWKKKGNLY